MSARDEMEAAAARVRALLPTYHRVRSLGDSDFAVWHLANALDIVADDVDEATIERVLDALGVPDPEALTADLDA